jgi:hypothetical protein
MGALDKERLTVVLNLQKVMVVSYAKLLSLMPKLSSLRHDIEHTTESTAVPQPKHNTDQVPTSQPNQLRLL